MATFTPIKMLRLLPIDLLQEYADKNSIRWLPDDSDEPEAFHKELTFQELSDSQRVKFEQMLRTVHEFRDEQGTQAILDEAEFDGLSLGKELDAIEGHPAKALWCWIRYPDLFNRVWLMRTIEQTSNRYWYTLQGLQSVKPQCDDWAIVTRHMLGHIALISARAHVLSLKHDLIAKDERRAKFGKSSNRTAR